MSLWSYDKLPPRIPWPAGSDSVMISVVDGKYVEVRFEETKPEAEMGRGKLLLKLIAFIRSLNLEPGQLIALLQEAMALFAGGFSLEKLLAFLAKLWALVPTPAGGVTAAAATSFADGIVEILEAAGEVK